MELFYLNDLQRPAEIKQYRNSQKSKLDENMLILVAIQENPDLNSDIKKSEFGWLFLLVYSFSAALKIAFDDSGNTSAVINDCLAFPKHHQMFYPSEKSILNSDLKWKMHKNINHTTAVPNPVIFNSIHSSWHLIFCSISIMFSFNFFIFNEDK